VLIVLFTLALTLATTPTPATPLTVHSIPPSMLSLYILFHLLCSYCTFYSTFYALTVHSIPPSMLSLCTPLAYCKVLCLLATSFDEVLMLDSDNIPTRDPAFLFDSRSCPHHTLPTPHLAHTTPCPHHTFLHFPFILSLPSRPPCPYTPSLPIHPLPALQ
jgi:hypothetical protein